MLAWQKGGAALAVSGIFLTSLGCTTGEAPRHYESAYQNFGSLCLVPAEDHSDSLDLMVMQTLRDRGFAPSLVEADDEKALSDCRSRVLFSVDEKKSTETMSLTFTDKYTGETYHVEIGDKEAGLREFGSGSPLTERALMIRRLVDRLFPESPLQRD